jgi:uncharacterized protein YggE
MGSSSFAQVENIPLLSINGEAYEKIIPDYAILSIRVSKNISGNTLNSLGENTLFRSEEIDMKFIDKDDVEIVYPFVELDRSKVGLSFIREFIVTVKDLSKLPNVILELHKRDLGTIYAISYRSSELEEAKNRARLEAVKNAQQMAARYATTIGQEVGKIHLITEEALNVHNWYTEKNNYPKIDVRNSLESNNPGYVTISALVKVSFDLKK